MLCFSLAFARIRPGIDFGSTLLGGKTMPTGDPPLTQFPLKRVPLTCCLCYVLGKNWCRVSSTYVISINSDPTYKIFLFCFSLAFARTRPGIGFGSRLLREKFIPLTYFSVSMLRIVANTNQFQAYKLKKCKILNKDYPSNQILISNTNRYLAHTRFSD